MKAFYYLLSLLFLLVTACSEEQIPKDIPFEMQPEGLQDKVEEAAINAMKEEVIEGMRFSHDVYSTTMPMCDMIEFRNILELKRYRGIKVIISGQMVTLEAIKNSVVLFYLANERLTQEETKSFISNWNYKFIDYPFYSRVSKTIVLSELEKNKKHLEHAQEDEATDYVEFYQKALSKWEKRLEAMIALNLQELKEVNPQAHIQVKDQMNTKGLSPLTIEALKGFLKVRDYAAQKYCGKSYLHLFFQAKYFFDKKALEQLSAINAIFPVKIVDESFAQLKGWRTLWNQPIEPPIEEF